jgi:hypothetical protein
MRNPFTKHSAQMTIIEWDHKIQTFPPDRSNQSLTKRIGLRCSNRRLQHLLSKGIDSNIEFCGERRVSIMDEKTVVMIAGYGFAQLLNRPVGRWVWRRVAVKDAAGADLHHNEYVNNTEADSNRDHEIARQQSPGVVADKRAPGL